MPERIPGFRDRFAGIATRCFGLEPPPQRLTIDAEVPLSSLTSQVMLALEQLAPYGAGNPPPLLLADRLQVVGEPKRVGNGEELFERAGQGTPAGVGRKHKRAVNVEKDQSGHGR